MKSIQILALSLLAIAPLSAAPIRNLPDLAEVFVFVNGNNSYTFLPMVGVNVQGNVPADVQAGTGAQFDLYYSNSNGTFNLDGEFLTITCNSALVNLPGCTIAAVGLAFQSSPYILFSTITDFRPGANYVAGSESFIIDNDLATFASLGNNSSGAPLISVTLGLSAAPSGNAVPEPSTYATLGAGLLAAAFLRRRNR